MFINAKINKPLIYLTLKLAYNSYFCSKKKIHTMQKSLVFGVSRYHIQPHEENTEKSLNPITFG